jgi:CheY-like chemotaxis protein
VFPAPAVPLNILVAEDNEFNVTLLQHLFDQKGHRARIACDGREALELATAETFDALLLDIHLPEMDGFAVAQAIRERELGSGKHLPIIAFTARSGKQDRQRCLAAGMDDFLSKPVQAEALWEVIERVAAAHAPPEKKDLSLIDPRVLLAACGGDAVILEKICQAFRDRLPDQLMEVMAAQETCDAARLREAAHKLCGVVAAFSTIAGGVASDLEDYAAQRQLEEARPLVAQLATMSDELMRLSRGLSIESLQR